MNVANLKKRIFFVLWAGPAAWLLISSNFSLLTLIPNTSFVDFCTKHSVFVYPGHLLVGGIVFMACSEYIGMLKHFYPKNGFWLVYLYLATIMVSHFIPDTILTLQQNVYILLLLIAMEAFAWGANKGRWLRASLLFSGVILLVISFTSLAVFYAEPFQSIFSFRSQSWMLSQLGIILVLSSIFLCDSAAYFVGSSIGKHHFSSISPNKTIEGSIAGLLTAMIVMTIGWYFLADKKFPLICGSILGILIGIIAQVGDLLVSLIKRHFRVKDASTLIPGHGGILDRFDSLFFTAPIVNLFILILHRIIP